MIGQCCPEQSSDQRIQIICSVIPLYATHKLPEERAWMTFKGSFQPKPSRESIKLIKSLRKTEE